MSVFDLLSVPVKQRLSAQGITEPTRVQETVIPKILEGKNIVFQSETGTGKTLAYLLPLVNRLDSEDEKTSVRIIITAPTIELASQINSTVKKITDRSAALIAGGAPIKRQLETLKSKPQIITGTAARLSELIRLKKLGTSRVFACVFDECDRLVKKEAFAATEELRSLMPAGVQLIACSATLTRQTRIFFAGINEEVLPAEDILRAKITHWALYAEQRDKIEILRKLLLAEKPQKALVFTSRSDQVENISSKLKYKGIECAALYARAGKQERKAAIDRFRSGKLHLLITSDLAARGLDIPDITHIIQMDFPEEQDFFIHRSGRTARAGKTGINVVIGDAWEMEQYARLEKKLKITVYPKIIYNGKVQAPPQTDAPDKKH